jgi:nucleoid-associated protein YgaU
MATDAPRLCPVCSEAYDTPPADCFRCETPLASWWPFEDAVRRSQPSRGPRILPLAAAMAVAALVTAVALRLMTGTAHAPVATVPPVATATPASVAVAPAPTPVPEARASVPAGASVTYRVQPGDSLWRVAAALTGDGRNWRTLWPALEPERPLTVGTMLEVPIR